MADLRLDPTTGNWIIVGKTGGWDSTFSPQDCPFCPGREALTPQPITTILDSRGNWLVRVFPDRFPVFTIEETLGSEGEGVYDKMHTFGAHEMIVENPRHGVSLAALHVSELIPVITVYRERITDLKNDRRMRYILIFKNQGEAAGSHINHLHSHLIATPVIPQRVELELKSSKRYYDFKERCLFCDIIRQEIEQDIRVVERNDEFIALCPFAPRFPLETWILPLKHHFSFQHHFSSHHSSTAFASLLKRILQRIETFTTAYHLVFHIAPNEHSPFIANEEWQFLYQGFHWHLEILPRIFHTARFKREEEFFTNPLTPEEATQQLKSVTLTH